MKKTINWYRLSCLPVYFSLLFTSCKKESITTPPIASLTVTNAIVGGVGIRLGSGEVTVANNNYSQLAVTTGESDLYIYQVGDSSNPCFRNPKFFAEERAVYSLFLTGQLPNATGIVLQDNIPYHTDSTLGIRIINLSPNSPALNITLSTTPTVNEISNMTYLQHTDFKLYPAKAANTSYTFQVRKASDNTFITGSSSTSSFSFNTPRFTNVTLVIRGMVGGSGTSGFGFLRVNNDR
jgi:hypothetical protein